MIDLTLEDIGPVADVTAEVMLALLSEGPPGSAARLRQALVPVARAIQERIELEEVVTTAVVVNEVREVHYPPSLAERLGFGPSEKGHG